MSFWSRNRNKPQRNQTQTQQYASTQSLKEKTVKTRVFQGQINNIFDSIKIIIQLSSKDDFNDSTVNMATDLVMNSLNNFAKNCYELHGENNSDALDIGKKLVYDKWNELKLQKGSKNKSYIQTLGFRDFMNTALNTNKLMTYNVDRTLSPNDQQRQNKSIANEKLVLSAYTKIIGHNNVHDRKVDSYSDDNINKKLQNDQQKELYEYRKNQKYRQHATHIKPNINSLYLTNSGRNSKFVNHGMENNEQQKNRLESMLFDGDSDDEKSKPIWINAVIKFNKNNKIWNDIDYPLPVQILFDTDTKVTKSRHHHKYKFKLPNPFRNDNNVDHNNLYIDPKQFEVIKGDKNRNKILKYEQKYLQKFNNNIHLGYNMADGENTELLDVLNGDMDNLNIQHQQNNVSVKNDNDNLEINNAVILLSKDYRLKSMSKVQAPYPCYIQERFQNRYKVKMAKPFNNIIVNVKSNVINEQIAYVEFIEGKHKSQFNGGLGYKSILEIKKPTLQNIFGKTDMDIDNPNE